MMMTESRGRKLCAFIFEDFGRSMTFRSNDVGA